MSVDVTVYREGKQTDAGTWADRRPFPTGTDGFVWVDLRDPVDSEWAEVATAYGLDPLAPAHTHDGLPTLDVEAETVFVALTTARFDAVDATVAPGDFLVFVGPGFAVTLRRGVGCERAELRRRIDAAISVGISAPYAVLSAAIELVVDDYRPAVSELERAVATIEADVFGGDRDLSPRIYLLSRAVIALHRGLEPMAAAIDRLLGDEIGGSVVSEIEGARSYLRETRNRMLRLDARLVDGRELLKGLLSVNLSLTGIRINDRRQDIVQQISAWAAIIAVPNLVTGIYGMNFRVMPELGWTWGYPMALGLVGLVCGLLFLGFRRSGWL